MFRFFVVWVIAAFIAVSVFYARQDYTWAEKEIASSAKGGWQIVYRQNIYSDPTYPWTLIVTPDTALYFMNPHLIERHGELLFLAPVTAKTYDYPRRTTQKHFFWAGFDLEKNKVAIFKADEEGRVVIQRNVDWQPIRPDSPSEGLAAYVRKHQS